MDDKPRAPPFGDLQLASLSDLPRIGVVAAAGFKHSQVFEFTRPYHDQYPGDTIKDYQHIFRRQILDPEWIVLIRQDVFDSKEDENEISIGERNGHSESAGSSRAPMKKVIVGVCSWKLEKKSRKKGGFQPLFYGLGFDDMATQRNCYPKWKPRDTNLERLCRVDHAIEDVEKEYFRHACMLKMIVVHPTYWRRGHGSALANWGASLIAIDNVDQGVIASRMGDTLFTNLGFEHVGYFHIEGDKEAPDGIDLAILALRKRRDYRP
ncbi:hypothetical protein F5884DRAFT_859200 [Xylogone sp. PMI_703]|nr:hypothetical protein F5884DRAFT_859200 [Xylogone sp. PMI_703]